MTKERKTAIVVEIRGRHAAVMSESGEFVRVSNECYEIGQTILVELPQSATPQMRWRARMTAFAGMVAGFLLLLFGAFRGYTLPVGVVSLDVNPSIEYTINVFDRVLNISAVNDDAEAILADMNMRALYHRPVDEAVDATILALRARGYLSTDAGNDVVISVSSYDARHTVRIATRLGEHDKQQRDLTVYSVAVSKGEVKSAHALGISAGKLHIIDQLGESWNEDHAFDPEDWIGRPVKRILRETELHNRAKKLGEVGGKTEDESPDKEHGDKKNRNDDKKEDDDSENGHAPSEPNRKD
jgi:hypothetical protein